MKNWEGQIMDGLLGHCKDLKFIPNGKLWDSFELKVLYILRGSF